MSGFDPLGMVHLAPQHCAGILQAKGRLLTLAAVSIIHVEIRMACRLLVVKEVKLAGMAQDAICDAMKESEILRSLKHPNIIRCVHCCQAIHDEPKS